MTGKKLDDYECLKALREAKAKEAKAKTTSLKQVKKELRIEEIQPVVNHLIQSLQRVLSNRKSKEIFNRSATLLSLPTENFRFCIEKLDGTA